MVKNGKLDVSFGCDIELEPELSTKFYSAEPDVDIQVEYVLNARKEISHIYFIEDGVKYKARKKQMMLFSPCKKYFLSLCLGFGHNNSYIDFPTWLLVFTGFIIPEKFRNLL